MAQAATWLSRAVLRRLPASIYLAVIILAAAAVVPAVATHGGPLVTPEFISHQTDPNPTCSEYARDGQTWSEIKFDPPSSGTSGGVTLEKVNDNTINWSSTKGIDSVVIKSGSDGHNLYRYDDPEADPNLGEQTHDGGLKSPGINAISHVSFCWDEEEEPPPPPPTADASASACDPLGEGLGAITVSVSNADGKDVDVTIDGLAGQDGSNDATAGDHTVVVIVDGDEVLNEIVTVSACSAPSVATATTCDPVGAATGAINVSVSDLAADDVAVVTIDGLPAIDGNNAATAGSHLVAVTVNGEKIHESTVNVLACSSPSAATSSTCDPFGAAAGGIDVDVSGLAAGDVAVVTIDGLPAIDGNNAATAGDHPVVVTVNGVEILNKTVTVAACSAPTAAASGACDPAGDQLGTISVSVDGLNATTDTAAVTIDGQPAVVGSNAVGIGSHPVAVSVNGSQILSENVDIVACTVVAGVKLTQQPEVLAAAQELPKTGPSFPVMPALLLSVILILLGMGLLLTDAMVAPISLMAYVPRHRARREWMWPFGR